MGKPIDFLLKGYQKQLGKVVEKRNALVGWDVFGGISLGLGLVGGAVAVVGGILGSDLYSQYKTATTTATASDLGNKMRYMDLALSIGIEVAVPALISGLLMLLASPDPAIMDPTINEYGAEIKVLQEEKGAK